MTTKTIRFALTARHEKWVAGTYKGKEMTFKFCHYEVTFAKNGKSFTVDLPEAVINRRLNRVYDEPAPKNDKKAKAKKTVTRKCMLCKHEFEADPAHRICTPCKSTGNWKSGGEYAIA